ncbi:MAG: carboxypeptidase-like regulatory domain-containing protein [Bacteroidales bacterium]|nr:carboxypeptidase-like regulatory domain-containing protein [Bacteroidales bacterium]
MKEVILLVLITILLASCASNNYNNVDIIKGKFKITNRTIDKNCKEGYAIITGIVYEKFTEEIMPFAFVKIGELNNGYAYMTDKHGEFYAEIPVGKYEIKVFGTGYTSIRKTIVFKEKENVDIRVYLGGTYIW